MAKENNMANADDLAFLDSQRRKHCVEPQHRGGPDVYHYVPAKCVLNRRAPARSSAKNKVTDRNQVSQLQAGLAVQEDALAAAAAKLYAEIARTRAEMSRLELLEMERVYKRAVDVIGTEFTKEFRASSRAPFAPRLVQALVAQKIAGKNDTRKDTKSVTLSDATRTVLLRELTVFLLSFVRSVRALLI